MEAAVYVAVIGLFSTLVAWLAGRNRNLAVASANIVAAYEQLTNKLSAEVDRLHARVEQLERLVTRLQSRRRIRRTVSTP